MNKQDYIDNRPELKARIRIDYNLPSNDPVVDAMLEITVSAAERGFMEMKPLTTKYADLICPWCGRVHYRPECQARMKELKSTSGSRRCWTGRGHNKKAKAR